jgi:hypothetical protein
MARKLIVKDRGSPMFHQARGLRRMNKRLQVGVAALDGLRE